MPVTAINPNLSPDIALAGELPPVNDNSSAILSSFGYNIWEVPFSNVITNHVAAGLNLLITEFRSKRAANSSPNPNNMYNLLTPFLEQVQAVEYMESDLATLRWLNTATGVQLDGLGDILVLDRDGMSDDEYRIALKFQIYINRSSGEPEVLIAFVKDFTNAGDVKLTEAYPAGLYIFTDGTTVISNFDIKAAIERIMASGVKLRGLFFFDPDATYFSFDWDGTTPTDGSKGVDELNYLESGQHVGGQLYEIII